MPYRSSAQATSNTTTLTINVPAGAVIGDLIVLMALVNGSKTPTVTWNAGVGFSPTALVALNTGSRGNNAWAGCAWKVFAGETGTYTVGLGAGVTGFVGVATAFSGRSASELGAIQAATTGPLGGNSSPVSIPLVGGTAAANDDILWFGCASMTNGGTWTCTQPAGYALHETISNSNDCFLGFSSNDGVASGATGTLTGQAVAGTGTQGGDSFGLVFSLSGGISIAWVT